MLFLRTRFCGTWLALLLYMLPHRSRCLPHPQGPGQGCVGYRIRSRREAFLVSQILFPSGQSKLRCSNAAVASHQLAFRSDGMFRFLNVVDWGGGRGAAAV